MNAPVPVMVPENILVPPFPAVSVPLPSVTLPAPASEATVSLLFVVFQVRLNVAPLLMTSGEVLAMRSLAPSCSVPAATVVVFV